MTVDPSFIRCDCGDSVWVIDRATAEFTCRNPKCKNYGKVFRPKSLRPTIERVKGADWKPAIDERYGHKI